MHRIYPFRPFPDPGLLSFSFSFSFFNLSFSEFPLALALSIYFLLPLPFSIKMSLPFPLLFQLPLTLIPSPIGVIIRHHGSLRLLLKYAGDALVAGKWLWNWSLRLPLCSHNICLLVVSLTGVCERLVLQSVMRTVDLIWHGAI